jgi:hypothetical protein
VSDDSKKADAKRLDDTQEEAARSTMGSMAAYAAPVMVALLAGERTAAAVSRPA